MTLKLEDLWQMCDRCKGSGKEPQAPRGPVPPIGPGPAITIGEQPCTDCSGKGGKPTAEGQAIIDLLRRAKLIV